MGIVGGRIQCFQMDAGGRSCVEVVGSNGEVCATATYHNCSWLLFDMKTDREIERERERRGVESVG